jgi:hypothetical protein
MSRRNKTLCVLVDHLYDLAISADGRFNILAVISNIPKYATTIGTHDLGLLTSFLRQRLAGRSDSGDSLRMVTKIDEGVRSRLAQAEFRSGDKAEAEKKRDVQDNALCSAYTPRWAGDHMVGPPFTVYIHYRDKVAYSARFMKDAGDVLSASGFIVQKPSLEANGEEVRDAAESGREGPHIDYFPRSDDTFADQLSLGAADQVAKILNDRRPPQLSPFEIKPKSILQGASERQGHFLGVWF